MSLRSIAFTVAALLASQEAHAVCAIHGARPTVPLPTMLDGQEFSFIASPDCETLRFTIRGTDVSKRPMSGGPVGRGPNTYKVVLTERDWNAVVAELGSTLTWIVTGTTSAGAVTRMVTTNELKRDEPITIDLSMADAKLVGNRDSGCCNGVAGAGDVNGDGNDDLLVGARENDEGGASAGAAYLVLGPVTGTIDLSMADAKLVGEESSDWAGQGVSDAGDVDGDGHDDILVGAPFNGQGGEMAGAAYLLLGPVTGTVDLSLADAKFLGEEANDRAGYGPSEAGDMDGDGNDDVLVGAWNSEGGSVAGATYLVLGPVTGTLDLALADAKLVGEDEGDLTGGSGACSSAGDVDADGHDDLLVSAAGDDEGGSGAGAAYLVLGPVSGTVDLSLADAKLVGEESNDRAGVVSHAGDVDGDGHDDVLIGNPFNDEGGSDAGAAYLVLGPVTGTRDLSLADAKLVGEGANDYAGNGVSGADVDDDGHRDLLVGAPTAGVGGAAYLVLGPVTGTLDLSLADAKFIGEGSGSYAGVSVSGTADVDRDGRDDVLIGAPYTTGPMHSYSGAAYLIYGGGL
jgi:hypothetical protein